jgi:hypothetical protein
MGQVLIPADQRVSIHVQAMPFEADKVKTILDMNYKRDLPVLCL